MTLHQLFDLATMEHRSLFFSYGAVLLLQGGYLVSTLRSSTKPGSRSVSPLF